MNSYRDSIRAVVRATRFVSSSKVMWFGAPVLPPIPRKFKPILSDDRVRSHVHAVLRLHLYRHFYCAGGASASPARADRSYATPRDRSFIDRLSEANRGTGHLQVGWRVRRSEPDTLIARRDGLELQLAPEEHSGLFDELAMVRFPKEFRGRSPGFYTAVSNTSLHDGDWHDIVRLYWHATPEGAVSLVAAATAMLNDAEIPFHLKVLCDPSGFGRCDAAVLYLRRADFPVARAMLSELHEVVSSQLGADVPALTKRLARGVGLAESPGGGMSFGEHRCDLLAEGLMRAFEERRYASEMRLRVVFDLFEERGVDLERPYLKAGSSDEYALDHRCSSASETTAALSTRAPKNPGTSEFMRVAERIAEDLCERAVRSDTRCNWMGADFDEAHRVRVKSLDLDLYDGTSGIALFLAELFAVRSDERIRETALAAIRQAIMKSESIARPDRQGLFFGWTGLALAAARVGTLLRDDDVLRSATRLGRRMIAVDSAVQECDLLDGSAGSIVALLGVAALTRDDAPLEHCARLGQQLIERAIKTSRYWSWPSPKSSRQPPLTGYAHGVAGIADALIALYSATGEDRYRHAAERGFAYERYWYNVAECNWPDFRDQSKPRSRREEPRPCAPFWCNGAPGIALSRLRAFHVTGDAMWKAEALTALETTRDLTQRALESESMGFSLCHGLAGNADVLMLGDAMLADQHLTGRKLASDIAATGIECHHGTGAWPLGIGGPAPGLMTGIAGIGHFYLRMANPTTPSVCLIDARAFAAAPDAGVAWQPVSAPAPLAVHAPAEREVPSIPPGEIAEELQRVDAGLRAAVDRGDAHVAEVCGHLFQAGGKRLRPQLALIAARCGNGARDDAIRMAVAIELLHTATLYHDDIVDEARMRRSLPSANARWGNAVAGLAGGFLFAQAMIMFAGAGDRINRAASRAVHLTWRGQTEEAKNAANLEIDEARYRQIITEKTATLYEFACTLGGIVAGLADSHVETLARFGTHFGIGFQLLDDVLDLAGDEGTLGKSVSCDLRGRILTLPVIRALAQRGSEAARLSQILAVERLSPEAMEESLSIIRSSGSLGYALDAAIAELGHARDHARRLPASAASETLCHIVDAFIGRANTVIAEQSFSGRTA